MATLEERIKYSPRSTFVVGGIVLAVLTWSAVDSPTKRFDPEIARIQQELADAEKKLAETEERFSNKGKFQEEMERVSQTFRLALDYLPKELDTQDLLKKISLEARSAGVELGKFTPKETVAKDFYEELPMDIQVKGSYTQLVTFLLNVSKVHRIINIRNVELGEPVLTDGVPLMQLSGTLVGYRYKEVK